MLDSVGSLRHADQLNFGTEVLQLNASDSSSGSDQTQGGARGARADGDPCGRTAPADHKAS